ncbi:MAG: LLM class flavin-dependent oxidoreductase, partial [Actinomycetia bacterium]|nr:LLM class flavin-dependent oxidoreductase [Actinomycetes bacterium]
MTALGMVFPTNYPIEGLLPVARSADDAGLDQLWLWEDYGGASATASAAAALASTRRLTVGIGLLPVPLRNVTAAAMEFATLDRLFPGRIVPGIGHGAVEWMGRIGPRAASPLTLLAEYADALRRLLRGERVTAQGRYVKLSGVALEPAPAQPLPVLVGGIRDKTVRLAGRFGDGLILASETRPETIPRVLDEFRAGRDTAQRDTAGRAAAQRDTAGRAAAQRDAAQRDTAGRAAAQRDAAERDAPGRSEGDAPAVVAFVPVPA